MTQRRPSTDDIVIRPVPPGGPDAGSASADRRVVVEGGSVGGSAVGGGSARAGGSSAAESSPSTPADDSASASAPAGDRSPLLDDRSTDDFLRRWNDVQARFVDDPRAAVLDADRLVAELVRALAERFSRHKDGLEEQWSGGSEPSTEELRLALQQYRSFFQRLLAT